MRWACTLVLASLVACNEHPIATLDVETEAESDQAFCLRSIPAVDVLIVMDDSPSMLEEVVWIGRGLREVAGVYGATTPALDWRIAVVSSTAQGESRGRLLDRSCRERIDAFIGSDLGPAGPGCLDVCALETLVTEPTSVVGEAQARPRPWVEATWTVNLPDGVELFEDLPCRGALGLGGGGPREPLAAMTRALERSATWGDPAFGFLRDDASLFVLFVTDADDESSGEVSEYAGLLASFRDAKVRRSPGRDLGVFVAVVGGVGLEETPDDPHEGCESERGSASAPHRLIELASEFGDFDAWSGAGLFSICADEWGSAPACLPGLVEPLLGAVCLDGCIDADAPACEIVAQDGTPVPECELRDDGAPRLPEASEHCAIVLPESSQCDAELVILDVFARPTGCYRSTCELDVRPDRECAMADDA